MKIPNSAISYANILLLMGIFCKQTVLEEISSLAKKTHGEKNIISLTILLDIYIKLLFIFYKTFKLQWNEGTVTYKLIKWKP